MAARRGFGWGAFVAGAVALLIVAIAAAAVVAFGGLYPVAASDPHTAGVRWLVGEARDHAVERGASGLTAPLFSAADIRQGAEIFKDTCQECHGGPGVEREEFAGAMNPRPPDLARAAGDLSVPEVFWIAKHGIKMSGMPAFGKTEEDADLWKVAAFVKALPSFGAAEYAAIAKADDEEHEHSDMAGDKGERSH